MDLDGEERGFRPMEEVSFTDVGMQIRMGLHEEA